jgi:RimJ/RimL family protein N-acetyltransferase
MTLPLPVRVESRNLVIRPVEEADIADLLLINGDDQVTRFLPYETWQSVADGMTWLQRTRSIESTGTGVQLVVTAKASGRVIGACLVFRYEEGSARAELGYVLGRAYWGKGCMREALAALIARFFEAGLRRLEAQVHPANIASCQLLERLGFRNEGLLRQRWVAKGETYDARFYGLLREEWLVMDRILFEAR